MRVARFAELIGLAIANADARSQLALRATTDPLTGLLNHRAFHERLEAEFDAATTNRTDLALILLDLDHFKDVNDMHGHQVGDRVLRTFARFLESSARFGDLVARIGGEEFAVLLPGADLRTATTVADRLVAEYAAIDHEGQVGRQSVSAGVCDISLANGPDDLKHMADAALYEAKAAGRNRSAVAGVDTLDHFTGDRRAQRLRRSRTFSALEALAQAIDAKDPRTARHSERVADAASAIAQELGWPSGHVDAVRQAALVHDIGKVGVPDDILLSDDELSAAERERLRAHAAMGASIVGDALSDDQTAWIRGNHERWDGGGYPDGLAGEAIPVGARILAVADAWDAMTNTGSYRVALTSGDALRELEEGSGHQFAPDVVDAVLRLANAGVAPFGTTSTPAPV